MEFSLSSFFSDVSDDSIGDQNHLNVHNYFFSETLACPPLDGDYLFGTGTGTGADDYDQSSCLTTSDDHIVTCLIKKPVQEDQECSSILRPNAGIHGKGKSLRLLEKVLLPQIKSEIITKPAQEDQECSSILRPNAGIHGKGKSLRLLEKVLLPQIKSAMIEKNKTCGQSDDRNIVVKRKADAILSDCKDETFWQTKLESTRQRLHRSYELEHKKRKTCKFIDIKACPKPSTSHRAVHRRNRF